MRWYGPLFLFAFVAIPLEAGASDRPPAHAVARVSKPRVATPIDFNEMIDHGQDRSQVLERRLNTKLKGKSLHLARGRVARGHDRQQASVAQARRAKLRKAKSSNVQVTLVPRESGK